MRQSFACILWYEACNNHSNRGEAKDCLEDAGIHHGAAFERAKETRGPREEKAASTERGNRSARFNPSVWLSVWLARYAETNVDSIP